ncbi:sensor histidine kinase [Sphingomonas ginkgonis]|uniref:Sensor histidine kinase n=1 Tax=Sphingomonas ginkgonis TaxID=2315330 RepID=A0A429VA89_9SPHN|nr:histidine kinase [Sphingomonas ginkgonis]RST30909.1 sensor histidine kinase [Sphingomonas ginkgonis]
MNMPFLATRPARAGASEPGQERRRFGEWRIALKSILGFWVVYALTVVARGWLAGDLQGTLSDKSFMILGGVVLTVGIYAAIELVAQDATIRRRALVAGVSSLLAACLQAGVLMVSDRWRDEHSREESRYQAREGFTVIQRGPEIRIERTAQEPLVLTLPKMSALNQREQLKIAADAAVIWLFFFAAWSAFYLATLAQSEALAAQRRLAGAERAAQTAQIRALRYQVNPHFLFNTLNSLSSLVLSGRPNEAEAMILKLSNFLRSTLTADATADVTLAEEIAMQRLYLDIETVRFPRRLKVEVDVPAELEKARLPALLLQPLIENAIKYGVSPTRDKVVLSIVARRVDDRSVQLAVTNRTSGGAQSRPSRHAVMNESTGVGLANVCQRLQARFGARAECHHGPLDEGGFEVRMTMPFERADG